MPSFDSVSLVPGSSKKPSKHRHHFRPVSKSKTLGQNNRSASKPNSLSKRKPAVISALVKATTQSDSRQLATDLEEGEAVGFETTDNNGQVDQNLNDVESEDSAQNQKSSLNLTSDHEADEEHVTNKTEHSTKSITTRIRKSTLSSTQSPRRSTRKRKQCGPSTIQIGLTREITSSHSNKPKESEIVQGTEHHNPPVATKASEVLTTSSLTAIVSVSQDQDILAQLGVEAAVGPRLSAFCSQFKVKKSKDKKTDTQRKKDQSNDFDDTNKDGNEAAAALSHNELEPVSAGDFTSSHPAPVGVPVVQIIDGEIVLQESSLMLPTRRTVREVEEEFQDNVVEEDAQLAIVQASYTSFLTKGDAAANGGKCRLHQWSLEETQKFYMAIRQLGTDFASMEALFDGTRTRRQLKQKYRKELIKNPKLVEQLALNPKYKTEIDMSVFDVEVDPERIKAYENEEPPPYEPTELDETTSVGVNSDPPFREVRGEISNSNMTEEGMEVVFEDAREERRTEMTVEGPQMMSSEQRTCDGLPKKPQYSMATEDKVSVSPPRWPAVSEIEDMEEIEEHVEFHEMKLDGPSMDDFFDDQAFEAPSEVEDQDDTCTEQQNRKQSKHTTSHPPTQNPPEQDSSHVLLIPKTKNSGTTKSRRPKLRPVLKKRKK